MLGSEVMIDLIKRKEIKGILVSILFIVLGVFLFIKPLELIETLLKVIGIILLIGGLFDFMNYFRLSSEDRIIDYTLMKGIMEITTSILFIFKSDVLSSVFPILLGLIIIFINIFKLEVAINLKKFDEKNSLIGVIISVLSIILGIVIILNPFSTLELVVKVSGIIIVVSELSNIIYSFIVLKFIRKINKVVLSE